jgi:hypothetical protein
MFFFVRRLLAFVVVVIWHGCVNEGKSFCGVGLRGPVKNGGISDFSFFSRRRRGTPSSTDACDQVVACLDVEVVLNVAFIGCWISNGVDNRRSF